ncbi:MAG: hypothetical protein ASARMPREDX12_005823 [Alectoria sarmentosa]|nr:MAG: hypothetical protein ASARMPRED_000822 [Alectoria sarmentosa]CAD6573128.1 MAG: hypothetical protein ASARMPREDX12_005823 [Alectoria sarmentosa]
MSTLLRPSHLVSYLPLPQNSHIDDDNDGGKERIQALHRQGKRRLWSPCLQLAMILVLLLLAGTAGFFIALSLPRNRLASSSLPDTVPQVPTAFSKETFRYNESFAAPPPQAGGPEPVWDSLIPNGLGYVKHPSLAPNLSVVSVFHQLHCLYTLRRAYYALSEDKHELEDFDFGIQRAPHAAHCFEYLRQALICSADSSIEPAGERVQGFLGWGFQRQCRDYGALMAWAEKWRAFSGHGFIAFKDVPPSPGL